MTQELQELVEMFEQAPQQRVTRESSPPRFALLKPVVVRPSVPYEIVETPADVEAWLGKQATRLFGFDYETKGTEPNDFPNSRIVGIGIASDTSSVYLPIPLNRQYYVNSVFDILIDADCSLVAHNLFFEGQWTLRYLKQNYDLVKWHRCTYLSYKLLASEGWDGQTWGLKDAQTSLLGWKNTNEVRLDEWLVSNSYVTGSVSKKFLEMTPEAKLEYYGSKENRNKKNQRKIKPDKGEMWRAPEAVLGEYCCLDAYSTRALWTEVLEPAERRFAVLPDFTTKYIRLLHYLVKQKVRGIEVDVSKLREVLKEWELKSAQAMQDFLESDVVRPHAEAYLEAQMKTKYFDKRPAKLKKNGEISKTYLNWQARRETVEADCRFNPNSNTQLAWLFYERLGYEVQKTTQTGDPSVDKQALPQLGEAGRLLHLYGVVDKERQYIEAAVNIEIDGRIHPSFRVPGTLTGRLSGAGGLNLQQVPKVRKYLECYRARKGYKWVQCDINSLEKVVLAERSRDEALWNLYGPDAKPNDVYLYDGAHLPGFREDILAAGYDPINTTAEMISQVKHSCKSVRKKVKPASLGFGYGMGPKKYGRTMRMLGFDVTDEDAFEVWKAYWKLYGGVKVWETELLRQLQKNDGWFLNGIGRPMGVHADKTKDIVNRDCLAEGTTVHVRHKGLVRIETVVMGDEVWDGQKWVTCRGIIDKGIQLCHDVNGVFMTKDHEVLVGGEMKEVHSVRVEDIETGSRPIVGWYEVWGLRHCLREEVATLWKNLCRRFLHTWKRESLTR